MSFTLGIEEELQTLHPATYALAPHAWPAYGRRPLPSEGMFSQEIHQGVLELQTAILPSSRHVEPALRLLRSLALARAQDQGQTIVATGMHPFIVGLTHPVHASPETHPQYARLLEEYGTITREALTFGMHIHVGVPEEHRILVFHALRELLPDMMALSVSAPIAEGRNTGIQSWRHSLLGRYPRMGIPDTWSTCAAYEAHRDLLRKTGCLAPERGLWEDLRLHHHYPTIEIRIADMHPERQRVALLADMALREAITVGIKGAPWTWTHRSLLEENKWRARRYGPSGVFVHWAEEKEEMGLVRAQRWLQRWHHTQEACAPFCLPWTLFEACYLQAWSTPSCAEHILQVFRESGEDWRAVVKASIQWTTKDLFSPEDLLQQNTTPSLEIEPLLFPPHLPSFST